MFEGVRKEGKKEGCRSLHIRIWVRGFGDQKRGHSQDLRTLRKRAFAEEVKWAFEDMGVSEDLGTLGKRGI